MIQNLLILTQLMGWTLLEARQAAGDPIPYTTAQDLALAGTKFFWPDIMMKNPAAVAFARGWHLQATGMWTLFQERRSIPAYDPFNNTVGYATVYSRYNTDQNLHSLTLSYGTHYAGVGLSWDTPLDVSYYYKKEDRLDVYTPVRRVILDQKGGIQRLTVAFGARITEWTLGLAYQYHQMTVTNHEAYWTPETGDSLAEDTLSLQGNGFAVGVSYRWGYRMKVGGTYRSGWNTDVGVGIPPTWDLAAELTPRTRRPSKIYFRVGREQWSRVSPGYRDIWRFHFGIRHGLYPRTAFMIGGMIRQSYARDLWITTYTGGLSHTVVPGLTLEVGIAWTPVSHGQFDNGTWTRIQETLTQVAWGIRWSR